VQEHQCKGGNVQTGEIWKDIKGYEGRYQVSNFGNIKSLARMRRGKNGSEVPVPEIIMSLSPKKDNGRTKPYVEVRLRDGSVRTKPCKSFLVHRLVASAFIKPLEKNEQVDHINGKHSDNRVKNLRIMHYVEHGKIHPLIQNGQLNKIGTVAASNPQSIAKMIATKAMQKAKRQSP
jgi:hypothetical protein